MSRTPAVPPRLAGTASRVGLTATAARARCAAAALVLALATALVGALAAPAYAHGSDAPVGTNYRTEVSGVVPARPGVTVRAIEAGARLELVNATGRAIEVLGYAGEPYLEVRPDGVYENVHSPATYVNQTLDGDTPPPATADPTRPPSWRRVSDEPVARWHDQRARWRDPTAPAGVRAEPGREHRVGDWTVPLRDGVTHLEIRGTLDWLPPPNPYPWWAAILLGALVVGALGLLPADSTAGRRALAGLGTVAGAGGLAAVVFCVARQIDAGADGPGAIGVGLLTGAVWPLLAGLGALGAGAYALVRRPAADFAVILAGSCLALFAGVANATVLARSVVPVPWPGQWARLVIALVLVSGAGVAIAGAIRLNVVARRARTAAPPVDHAVVVGGRNP